MPIADTSVKHFSNLLMPDLPALTGEVGSNVDIFDYCLVNGGTLMAVASLVVSGNIATVTTSGIHPFTMLGSTGPVVLFAGVDTPSELNGEWRIKDVTSITSFTIETENIPDMTASGTITVSRAPVGWTKAFSGTNKAAYLGGFKSNGHFLRVLDDTTVYSSASGRWSRWCGYEDMADIDTGTAPFPSLTMSPYGGMVVMKSRLSGTAARDWILVANDRLLYFFPVWHDSYQNLASIYIFGKTGSLRAADAYDTLIAGTAFSQTGIVSYPGTNNDVMYLGGYNTSRNCVAYARSHNQLGSATLASLLTDKGRANIMGYGGWPYPLEVNNGVMIARPGVVENGMIRTPLQPGAYYADTQYPAFDHLFPLENVEGVEGRTLLNIDAAYSSTNRAQIMLDITGPWLHIGE